MIINKIPGDKNDADIFTKNLTSAMFNPYMPLLVGHSDQSSKEEAVAGQNSPKLITRLVSYFLLQA